MRKIPQPNKYLDFSNAKHLPPPPSSTSSLKNFLFYSPEILSAEYSDHKLENIGALLLSEKLPKEENNF